MDDLDELISAAGPGARSCTAGWWLTHGDHPDIARLAAAVVNPSATAEAVAVAFGKRGMAVGAESIRRHRRGICACPR